MPFLIGDKLKQVEKKKGATVDKSSQNTSAEIAIVEVDAKTQKSHLKSSLIHFTAPQFQPLVQKGDGIGSFAVHSRTQVSIHTLRQLWKRSDGKCEFVSPQGRRCRSPFALEVEHLIPVALGGTNELKNLKHLCKTHNLWNAERVFGNKVSQYLRR